MGSRFYVLTENLCLPAFCKKRKARGPRNGRRQHPSSKREPDADVLHGREKSAPLCLPIANSS